MIGFELVKKYRDLKTSYNENKNPTHYASINSHLRLKQSRRDDMESLGYVMLYFLRDSLPWQELKMETQKQKKMTISIEDLCCVVGVAVPASW
jgi:hypothetical protein